MAEYRFLHTSFWTDSFVQSLPPEQKFFYLVLLTNPKTSWCGIYEITPKDIDYFSGLNVDTVKGYIDTFEDYGKIAYSYENNEIIIRNWHKYHPVTSSSIQICVEKELEKVKTEDFKLLYDTAYREPIDSLMPVSPDPSVSKVNKSKVNKNKVKKTNKQLAEYVSMSENSYTKLIKEYGEEATQRAIHILDNYKGSTGKQYKDDYRAILNWVMGRALEELKANPKPSSDYSFLKTGQG